MNRIRILILLATLSLTAVAGVSTNNSTGDVAIQLHAAVRSKDAKRVQANLALDDKAVNYPAAEKGWSALHFAAEYGSSNGLEVLKLLLTHGAKIEAKNIIGQTPLFSAVIHNNPEGLKILIEHGANVNAQQAGGQTPLHVAALNGYYDVAQILIQSKSLIKAKDSNGETPLQFAITGLARARKDGDVNAVQRYQAMVSLLRDSDNRQKSSSIRQQLTDQLVVDSISPAYPSRNVGYLNW